MPPKTRIPVPVPVDETKVHDDGPVLLPDVPAASVPVSSGPIPSVVVDKTKNSNNYVSEHILVDVPNVYLLDRSNWTDFKKCLNECGMTWNLPGWMTTIVYKGHEWQEYTKKGVNLEEYFPTPEKTTAGDGISTNVSQLGNKLVGMLGLPKNVAEYRDSTMLFCNLQTVEFEPDRKLAARQKFWTWFVKGLRGPKQIPGQYYYLVDEVQPYDIQFLFKRLCQVLEQVTICSLDDELEAVIKLDFKPQSQTIFSYYADLRKAIKRLHDVNERLPNDARIVLPDSYIRSRLVRAARQVPVFKPIVDSLLMKTPEEWGKISVEGLYHQLEQTCANDQSASTRTAHHFIETSTNADFVAANTVKIQSQKKKENKSVCHSFIRTGECKRAECPYSHTAPVKKDKEKKSEPVVCMKCGDNHLASDCKFSGQCTWCRKLGHKEHMCKSKKIGKPQALVAAVSPDGEPIRANIIIVEEDGTQPPPKIQCYNATVEGKIKETFFADTGANRSIHPNTRAAANFYRVGLNIGTAHGGKCMKSEGVGKMLLYTSSGDPMPGFDRVVFAPQVAEKLCSVGDLCDAGLVCVFTQQGLHTYKSSDVKISGKEFTYDERDKNTRLFPLSLYRKSGERDISSQISALSDISASASTCVVERNSNKCEWQILPEFIEDGEGLPAALLAKTYIKSDLSEIDRYHAKFGDVGIKYIKRALPGLKIPSQYRCEYCIEGKIHRFGHKACAPGTRTEYEPGVCLHSDHSGPYAKSLGGHRYSQLFLDRGSKYLWAVRMTKKSGHYMATPSVLTDSAALSGRPVQIFHSDGDGVFSSRETQELLAKEKIRHEFSAPYDSNTNPFIERARRTIFEGVCTALLRSGAPASFWGEAECHKIFTINVLPTEKISTEENVFVSRKNLLEGNRRPFNLERLMAFGTAVTCYVPKEKRKGGKEPAQRRSFRGVLMGYAENMPAYRVWDIEGRKLTQVSYNFTICHEGYYPFRDKKNWTSEMLTDPTNFSPVIDGVLTTYEWKKFNFDEEDAGEVLGLHPTIVVDQLEPHLPTARPPDHADPPLARPEEKSQVSDEKSQDVDPYPQSRPRDFWKKFLDSHAFDRALPQPSLTPPDLTPALEPEVVTPLRRSERLIEKSNFSSVEDQENLNLQDPFLKPISIGPPKTLREARLSPWWPQYHAAAQTEYDGHIRSKTWELVPKSSIPKGKNILRGKWVFDDKRGEDGKILKFKARFVAMGFTQKEGVDFTETFAGVVIAKSFRIMLGILNEDPTHEMEHWDVRMAFTQAFLDEEIYMYQPELFEKDPENFCCRLRKSLYGLKQAARNWQQMLQNIFRETGFFSLKSDPCVFFLKENDSWCMCSTHVDDIFTLYNKTGRSLRDRLFKKISSNVEIEDLGPISWALKTTILRNRTDGLVKISQEQYIREFLAKKEKSFLPLARAGGVIYGKSEKSRKSDTPNFPESLSDLDDPHLDREDLGLKKEFESCIGAFWWLAQISRPDIYFAVHRCAKLVNSPTPRLGLRIKKILDYLAATPTMGLVYQRHKNPALLSGFVDAAFASEENYVSRCGYFFLFRGNLVSWSSENPKRKMTSSTEVECRGLVQISKENMWHRQFHLELNLFAVDTPTIIFEDNTASISMAEDHGTPHKRSKHFGLEWAYFKECVELQELTPVHVSTNEQLADMMTKPLNTTKFKYFRDLIMGDSELQSALPSGNPI